MTTKPTYCSLASLVALYIIKEPNRSACFQILEDNIILFGQTAGSSNNHQAWRGGYVDHVEEVMNFAVYLYEKMNFFHPLPFKLEDALLVLFLHDLEKPWKEIEKFKTKQERHEFRLRKITEYGMRLTPEQQNAIKYVEGEGDDYSSLRRVMNPLAAFCHMVDIASARIWFNHPLR